MNKKNLSESLNSLKIMRLCLALLPKENWLNMNTTTRTSNYNYAVLSNMNQFGEAK